METIDYILIIAYLAIVSAIGYFSSRKESDEEYLIAGRKLGFFNSAASIIASKIGGGMLMVYVAYIYVFGISAFTYFFGAILGYIVFYFFASKVRKKSDDYLTISDYLEDNYGEKGVIWFSYLIFSANVLNYSMQLVAAGKILEMITGLNYGLSVGVMLAITLLYMILGGFKAVVLTDVVQAVSMVILFAVISFLFGTHGLDTSLEFQSLSIATVIGFFLIGIVMPFCSTELWQRVFATKDIKSVKKSLIISSSFYFIMGLILTFLGFAMAGQLPGVDPDLALLIGFSTLLPSGLAGIGVIAMLSAIMSSADTWMYNCSSIFLNDIMKIRAHVKKYYRVAFVITGILGVISAIAFKSMVELVVLYAILYMACSFFVLFAWLFKFKSEYLGLTYPLVFISSIALIFFAGIKPETGVFMLFIVPVCYLISICYNKIIK